MRVLVSCPECSRQLDAGGLDAGAQFRCPCGAVVTVPAAKGHDAAVVRCSSCGAPREERAAECRFCGSDFTLHERDLHTVCPSCFARISDRARYCHHCATEIVPQGRAGEPTDTTCPCCGDSAHLASRRFPGIRHPVLECGRCAGMWLSHELLQSAVRTAREQAIPGDVAPPPPPPPVVRAGGTTGPAAKAPFYRPCPVCGSRMLRKNWGARSGVIVDVCSAHGVWFDADELAAILRWVRGGGLDRVRAERASRPSEPGPSLAPSLPTARTFRPTGGGWLGSVLEVVTWIGVESLLD